MKKIKLGGVLRVGGVVNRKENVLFMVNFKNCYFGNGEFIEGVLKLMVLFFGYLGKEYCFKEFIVEGSRVREFS